MTTNQKLRDEVAHWKEAFSRAASERAQLEKALEEADLEYRVCIVASLVVVLTLVAFIIVSDLVG